MSVFSQVYNKNQVQKVKEDNLEYKVWSKIIFKVGEYGSMAAEVISTIKKKLNIVYRDRNKDGWKAF